MKTLSLAVLLAALTLPIAVSAQVSQQPPVQSQMQPGQAGQAAHEYRRWTKRLAGLSLSPQQQQHVQGLLDQFAAQHPAGSARDESGAHALRDQITGLLNPQQQTQLRQTIQQEKAQHMQRHMQGQPMGQPQQMQPMQPQQAPPAL
jgi:hypothetical protein